MAPDKRIGPDPHPGRRQPRQTTTATITRWPAGCPCGCRTRLPWLDDPDCIRNRPLPPARDWPAIDVAVLGLAPHRREACDRCRAVGT